MLDAGMILIVSAREVSDADLDILRSNLMDRAERIITVWAGDEPPAELSAQLQVGAGELERGVGLVKQYLRRQGYIFNYE